MSQQSKLQQVCHIPVVIVESHQHILEHIHHVLRKNKELLKGWTMIHYDAHPDMACSVDLPARVCFAPRSDEAKSLYDRLDETTTGISEWILPLVLAANLEQIHWIKPLFSHQFPVGISTFNVGVVSRTRDKVDSFLELDEQAVVRVDLDHPYYIDDNVVEKKLQLAKKVNFKVSHAEEGSFDPKPVLPWMLDICLDYFVCRNPFITDIQVIDEMFAKIVLSIHEKGIAIAQQSRDYILRRDLFFRAFTALLLKSDQGEQLKKYFGKQDSPIDKNVKYLQCSLRKHPKLGKMTAEALPYLSMPHNFQLPSMDVIEESVNLVVKEIQAIKQMPFLITIARSANDGFCPQSVVDKIQRYLLQKMEALYGSDDHAKKERCNIIITRDYGEWEGSTLDDTR